MDNRFTWPTLLSTILHYRYRHFPQELIRYPHRNRCSSTTGTRSLTVLWAPQFRTAHSSSSVLHDESRPSCHHQVFSSGSFSHPSADVTPIFSSTPSDSRAVSEPIAISFPARCVARPRQSGHWLLAIPPPGRRGPRPKRGGRHA